MSRKRKLILMIILIITIIALIIYVRRPKDYSVDYQKDGYKISETYKKLVSMYYFSLEYNGQTYDIGIYHDFLHKKELIKKVDTLEGDNYTCVYLKSDDLKTYPICYSEDKRVDYSLIEKPDDDFFKLETVIYNPNTYDGITVNTFMGKGLAVWNHNGFTYIKDSKSKNIKLLENESYYDGQSFQIGKYVLIPNYDENYEFKTFYVLDLKTGKYKTWELENKLSFNFYYLGEHNGKGYIVDKKSKEEYEINPKKRTIKNITNKGMGKVWDGSWNEVSMTKLVNTEYTFLESKAVNYLIDDNKLYLEYYKSDNKVLISNKKISKIVFSSNEEVYYLVKDQLYRYSPEYGEVLIAQYSEWEFNNLNTIYIY